MQAAIPGPEANTEKDKTVFQRKPKFPVKAISDLLKGLETHIPKTKLSSWENFPHQDMGPHAPQLLYQSHHLLEQRVDLVRTRHLDDIVAPKMQ